MDPHPLHGDLPMAWLGLSPCGQPLSRGTSWRFPKGRHVAESHQASQHPLTFQRLASTKVPADP